ncbi:MAG: hypothetical protein HXL07_02785 [Candidatus Nanosynbacter sp.]|nr:hypothetical protein [Candidatus Nanosynbacter sp.]
MEGAGVARVFMSSNFLLDNVHKDYNDPFAEVLFRINAGKLIDRSLANSALNFVLNFSNQSSKRAMLASLLVGLGQSSRSEDTILGLIDAISDYEGRDLTQRIVLKSTGTSRVVALAGSGKKGLKTINISTISMITAIASGAMCVKNGSSATSSLIGSSDFVRSLGIYIPNNFAQQEQLFYETGFGFFTIESLLPRFDSVYGGIFFAPHILSYALPAVVMPIEADILMYGFAGPDVDLSTRVLNSLGFKNNLVVNNTPDTIHYVDEATSIGITSVAGTINGVVGNTRMIDMASFLHLNHQVTPSFYQLKNIDAQVSFALKLMRSEFKGSIVENTVCINAGNIVYLSGIAETPEQGFEICKNAIHTGLVQSKLEMIRHASKRYR